jgi:cytochrome c biogenesis protein CcdA
MKNLLAFLLVFSLAFAVEAEQYYGIGCPHCGATYALLESFSGEYNISIARYEVYQNNSNREMMFRRYDDFGLDIRTGGVPTTILDDRTFIVGEIGEADLKAILEECKDSCPGEIVRHESSALIEGGGESLLAILVGAAIVDSINPCTIAVMVLLIGAVLYSKGRRNALFSGILFAFTIFFMYIFYGFGILQAISTLEMTRLFYTLVTVAAFVLAIMEVRAFIDYKPGMMALEMPMFLRPYAKKITSEATSPLGVILAAVFCSVFLIPCSSGPYLIVLGMLAKSATLQTVGYLLLYNLIFILPMLVITVLIFFGKTTVEKVGKAKDKYVRYIHLVSGIILFLLFFLMVMELSRIF